MKEKERQDDVDDAGNPGEMDPQVVRVCTLLRWQSLQEQHKVASCLSALCKHSLSSRSPISGDTHKSFVFGSSRIRTSTRESAILNETVVVVIKPSRPKVL
jgi:hypothetical protein